MDSFRAWNLAACVVGALAFLGLVAFATFVSERGQVQAAGRHLVVEVPAAWTCAPTGVAEVPVLCKQLRGVRSTDRPRVRR